MELFSKNKITYNDCEKLFDKASEIQNLISFNCKDFANFLFWEIFKNQMLFYIQ